MEQDYSDGTAASTASVTATATVNAARQAVITDDPTLLIVPEPFDDIDGSRPRLFEANLVYLDLRAPEVEQEREILRAAGGVLLASECWCERPPALEREKLDSFLNHLSEDLNIEVWDFTAAHRADPDFNLLRLGVVDPLPGAEGSSERSVRSLVAVYTTSPWNPGPSGPPEPAVAPGHLGNPRAHRIGPVRLGVLDAGVPDGYDKEHPYLAGVADVPLDSGREKPFRSNGQLQIDAGHGLFIMDIIYRANHDVAPMIMAQVSRDDTGLTLADLTITNFLHEMATQVVMRDEQKLVVNMSFSANASGDHSLTGLAEELRWLNRHELDVLCVVAAGNDSSSQPTWPANYALEMPNVVSVGALDPDGKHVAAFSNRGDWVQCWVVGSDDGAYLPGDYPAPPRHFPATAGTQAWAKWQGTSFAAPMVAAAIARQAEDAGQSLRDAWDTLRRAASSNHPVDQNGVVQKGVILDLSGLSND